MLHPYDVHDRGFVRQHRIQGRCSAERVGLRGPDIERRRPTAPRESSLEAIVYGGWELPLDEGWTAVWPTAARAPARRRGQLGSPLRHRPRIPALQASAARWTRTSCWVSSSRTTSATTLSPWERRSCSPDTPLFHAGPSGALVEHPWDYVDKTRPDLVHPSENVIGWLNAFDHVPRRRARPGGPRCADGRR